MSAEVISHPSAITQSLVHARTIAKRADLYTDQELFDACDVLMKHGNHMDYVLGSVLSRRIRQNMYENLKIANDRARAEASLVSLKPLKWFLFGFAVSATVMALL